jgi:uncharacterized protein (TIGR04255 family)
MEKLPKAPLQEVIFEAKWPLSFEEETKKDVDPGLKLALGKLQKQLRETYPDFKAKVPVGVPEYFFNGQAIYQFWSEQGKWPVVQLGPGIITVNDTDKNYTWANFKPRIDEALENLFEAYESKFSFESATLRYIDVIRIEDYKFSNWPKFIQENLEFSFESSFDQEHRLKAFQFDQSFDLDDLGDLNVRISSGTNKGRDVFIWQIAVVKNEEQSGQELKRWLEKAHDHTSDLFKRICKPALYESFK